MSDFLSLLADAAVPPVVASRWYCDREGCDGEPHGEHWRWCHHPCDGYYDPIVKRCDKGCSRPEKAHHDASCRHARSAQCPPDGDWSTWLLLTGRGFGKSRAAAEWLVESAWTQPAAEWCVIARNAADVRKNARDLTAGLEVITRRDGRLRQYNRADEDLYLNNGAVIHCLSADKPDRLRGFNLAGAWADELCAWRFMEETWDYALQPALRVGTHPRVVVTTTPKPVRLLKRLVEKAKDEEHRPARERRVLMTTGSTFDNARNLSMNVIEDLRATFGGTRLGRQELEGELIFDLSGTLVDYEMIHTNRVTPEEMAEVRMSRIAVGVDPAGSYGESSDETGIVVCGKGDDGHGYVLEDHSGKYSPREWATAAARCYERWGADVLVAEVNVGNNLVEEVVRSVAPHVHFKEVRALVGKLLRAEPVTALYEQARIHHVGTFERLETQLCTFTPEQAMKNTRGTSPDRMDAMVHAFTELGLVRWGTGRGWIEALRGLAQADRDSAPTDRRPRTYLLAGEPPEATETGRCQTPRYFGPTKRCVVCGGVSEEHRKTA